MFRTKLTVIFIFASLTLISCFDPKPQRYSITDSKAYEASLFRQHCAICHGPEGLGKTLDDGTIVPNMRYGELLKFKTEAEIYKQISDGGNGMVSFRNQLSSRELDMMAKFVLDELRKKEN